MAPNAVESNIEHEITDSGILNGKFLAHPPPGEDICITGLSGIYPLSEDVHQFRDNLYNKVDMVSDEIQRWEYDHPEIPKRGGRIPNIQKFDAGFFGVHYRQADCMDPSVRLILEKSVEAILDAGLHPSDLEGTKTGVFVGSCFSEAERHVFFDNLEPQQFGLTGVLRSMIANRVSYFLKLKGPSYISDTACSSAFFAMENAYCALRRGLCDMALVGGTSVTLHPLLTLQFSRLGVLGLDGCCKSFDASGNGYVRSEAISCVLLQKSKDAKRIYGRLIHTKTNCDGFKPQSITYPLGDAQKVLLEEFYQECGIDPRKLSYLEAHVTGTKVGDPEEMNAMDKIFCTGRETVLLVGGVKSNMGHPEPSSGMCALTKCIIAMEEGYIPPNIHYSSPREGIEALEQGRVRVVVNKTPFEDDRGLIGINNFGFGGSNCHVLLHWNPKVKVNGGEPLDDLPRLVCVSGRVPEAITTLTEDVLSRKLDAEHIALLHNIFRKDIEEHTYRGYTIASKTGGIISSYKPYKHNKIPFLLAMGTFGSSWQKLAKQLLCIPVFASTMKRVQGTLQKREININEIIQNSKVLPIHPVVNNILGNVATQIGIIEVLKDLEMRPNKVIGYAVGELVCAYYDGSLSLEQTILCAYEIGNLLKDINIPTSVHVVHLSEQEIVKILPKEIEVIWQNTEEDVTISGEPAIMKKFIEKLREKKTETHEVAYNEVTLHTRRNIKLESELLSKLQNIISSPIERNGVWLSTSSEQTSSPEYFLKVLHAKIQATDLRRYIRKNQVITELGNGSFANILKASLDESTSVVKLSSDSGNNGIVDFLKILGNLYENGFNPQIQKLYPKVQFPVSRGTPMISPKIKWDHSKDWFVMRYVDTDSMKSGERTVGVSLKEEEWQYVSGHVIDGRNLFPAIAYLYIVWDTLAIVKHSLQQDMKVVFESCKFNRATNIGKDVTNFNVTIQGASGDFEISEGGTVVVNGTILLAKDDEVKMIELPKPPEVQKPCNLPLKGKDVYKELRLRGYNYKGAFRAIEEVNYHVTKAYIRWDGNWVAFMDNMLQLNILQMDTRLLYVPTSITQMIINAKKHLEYVETFGDNPLLPVYAFKDAGVLRCGGIEIRGLKASAIARRKPLGQPVLEKYVFVPNDGKLPLDQCLRVNMQLALENMYTIKLRAVELIDEATTKNTEVLAPQLLEIFGDQPLIQATVVILSQDMLNIQGVQVEKKSLEEEEGCFMVVGSKILQRLSILQQAFGALKPNGFVLSREDLNYVVIPKNLVGIDILTTYKTETEQLILIRKSVRKPTYTSIEVSNKDDEFRWLPNLQDLLKNDEHTIIYAQEEEVNGVMGLFNCIRKEPGGMNVKCVLTFGNVPLFKPSEPFYDQQLSKNMVVNVYKDGRWGTYRHLLMNHLEDVESEHFYANPLTRGDFSTLRWVEGELNLDSTLPPGKTIVQIYYSPMNFRDVMTASGRISADVITMDRTKQECVQGFEFVGRDLRGKRVMGMMDRKALGTLVEADQYMLWKIPDDWTMEQAATVPIVYTTVLFAFIQMGKIQRGDSVLIHSGTGGVGQAAINIAQAYGCEIFTTVGNNEKREWLKKLFPALKDSHIGCSRDVTFEQMVKKETSGRGVDLVLNSLADDKLIASVRCLAPGGRFLEIGKFDLAKDSQLALMLLEGDRSFHSVMMDMVMDSSPQVKKVVSDIFNEGLKSGAVKPLNTNVFKMDEMEQAFRFMASGRHTGKVMIKIRDEETEKIVLPKSKIFKGLPRYYCDPEKSYIIAGGLGGFGLELADWLVLRGARRLVLTSRTGVQSGYQAYRMRIWRSYGALLKISTADITTAEGCEKLISEAEELGPVHGIFNLAVVLLDSLLENQTRETFQASFGPKAVATKHLDDVTRRKCPNLRDFVIFSSVVCGRGNTGQTNYGMANSVMERICDKRKKDGFPGLAIEWGAVGDVGLVAEMQELHTEIEIGGTLQQRITSCLQVMDNFLRQKEAAIVSSIVVAEKKSGSGGADNIVDAIANILGIKKQTVSAHATLAEIGMDSMTAVEIKQTLEREFEVFLTAQDIRNLTLTRLQEIQSSGGTNQISSFDPHEPAGFQLVLRYIGDEATCKIPIIRLSSLVSDDSDAPLVFCFPGIEGFASTLKPMAANLRAKVYGVQFCYDHPTSCHEDMVKEAITQIEKIIKPNEPLHIITYSWGTNIGLDTMSSMEAKGYKGTLTCIDGSPELNSRMCQQELTTNSEAEFETILLCHLMALYMPYNIVKSNKDAIFKSSNLQERISILLNASKGATSFSEEYLRASATAVYYRVKQVISYMPKFEKIQSPTRLCKASKPLLNNLSEDYGLSDLCRNFIGMSYFEGTHVSMLENIKLAESVNEFIGQKR